MSVKERQLVFQLLPGVGVSVVGSDAVESFQVENDESLSNMNMINSIRNLVFIQTWKRCFSSCEVVDLARFRMEFEHIDESASSYMSF